MGTGRAFFPAVHAERDPDVPAVVMAGSGAVVTYGELEARSNRLAHALAAVGLCAGDHVAIFLPNHERFFEVIWAAQRAGMSFTPISSLLTSTELAYIVEDCGADALISSATLAGVVSELGAVSEELRLRLAIDGTLPGFLDYEEVLAGQDDSPVLAEALGSEVFYSSGTTGRPKGVRRSGAPVPPWDDPPYFAIYRDSFGFVAGMVWLSAGPLYHAGPLMGALAAHAAGGTVVVMERFDARQALDLIAEHRVTHAQWVPTMFSRMLKLPEEARAAADVSSLKVAIHGAAPCPRAVKAAMLDWWGPILVEFYTATEGIGMTLISSEEWLARPGSVGRPLFGVPHIVNDDGEVLGPGEVGTIYFSDGLPFEYRGSAEQTAAAHDARGWATVNDVGYVDDDGYLYLTDRKAFMIVVGGVNIYPQEIEDVLVVHDLVADVAVIGVPNDDLGEEVKAVVVLAEGVEPSPMVEAQLREWCRSSLARTKVPRSFDFADTLPRLPTGKLQKALLRERYWKDHENRIV